MGALLRSQTRRPRTQGIITASLASNKPTRPREIPAVVRVTIRHPRTPARTTILPPRTMKRRMSSLWRPASLRRPCPITSSRRPGDSYIWIPGYWSYADSDYYWVPGAWVMAPWVGALWTPPWWGFYNGAYIWHRGLLGAAHRFLRRYRLWLWICRPRLLWRVLARWSGELQPVRHQSRHNGSSQHLQLPRRRASWLPRELQRRARWTKCPSDAAGNGCGPRSAIRRDACTDSART